MRKYQVIALIIFLFTAILMTGCTKQVPKEMMNQNQNQNPGQINPNAEMPNDSIHRNIKPQGDMPDGHDSAVGDEKADKLINEADAADAKFVKTKSDADKKEAITKQLTAANYLMFEANLSPKKKYRPALKRYNRILELDPANAEAMENKKQIEEIYQSMGMPVPN